MFLLVFFIKQLLLVSLDMPESNFEFCKIFAKFFKFEIKKNRLPVVNDSREIKNFAVGDPVFQTLVIFLVGGRC